MLGKNQITISGTQLAAGLASSDYLGDGGIGMLSTNINPVLVPGVVYATNVGSLTAPSTGTPVNLVATSEDSTNPTAHSRIAVDGNGNFIRIDLNSSNSTRLATGTNSYAQPFTDMVSFNGFNFASSTQDITKLTVSSGTLNESYWHTTLSQTLLNANFPHPMLVFQKLCWLADGNNLNNFNAAGTPTVGQLVLRAGETITALGIDPGTGLMMIGVSSETDGDTFSSSSNFILLYDGYSPTERRRIPVQGTVTFFYEVGGTMFVGMDSAVNTWNGNGVTFLRRFTEVGSSPNQALIKPRVSSFLGTLLVGAGNVVYAYGDIINGKKVWYPIYGGSSRVDCVAALGTGTSQNFFSPGILASSLSGGALTLPVFYPLASAAGTGMFYTNNINFPRPVIIKGFRIFTTGITTTTGIGSVGFTDENQATKAPTVNKFVVASTASPHYWFDFPFDHRAQTLQPFIGLDTQAFGVVRIVIFYDPDE